MDELMSEASRLFVPGFFELLTMAAFAIIAIILIGVGLFVIVRRLSLKGGPERPRDATLRSESRSNH